MTDNTTRTALRGAVQEVMRLHSFFQDWYRGEVPNSDEAFSRLEWALGPGFRLLRPDGTVQDRAGALEMVRSEHGRQPGYEIEIRKPETAWSGDDLALLEYEEWRRPEGGEWEVHLSTALLRLRKERWRWLHVHETLLPSAQR
jgi:hypothetical protein